MATNLTYYSLKYLLNNFLGIEYGPVIEKIITDNDIEVIDVDRQKVSGNYVIISFGGNHNLQKFKDELKKSNLIDPDSVDHTHNKCNRSGNVFKYRFKINIFK